ncbi:MAG: N-acetylglucosamine-6-phosphate deacetylase [Rubrobacter sp.]|nr:N-acetylglucosamine-6-phosphate deacetylase [Rubrobacter sp.]
MKALALRGRVVTDREVLEEATVLVEDGRISAVSRGRPVADEACELPESYLVPGFVDLQVNGSFGVDVATMLGRVPELSEKLLSTGTTAYLPTAISLPRDSYPGLLAGLDLRPGRGAEALGLHLEGPFINPARRGAHPAESVAPPDAALLREMMSRGSPLRLLTLAPEMEGAAELVAAARSRGVTVSAGHSDAPFETAYRALEEGVRSVTHLFNAMSPLHHREPGLAGAALAHPRTVAGIIADGRHVHPGMVRLAYRLLGPDRIYLVTDAISAAGAPPGTGGLSLAGQPVYLGDGTPRLASGELSGSLLRMDEALRNILRFTGCTLPEAVRMASTTPARLIGEGRRRGRLSPGHDADVVALSDGLEVEAVWKGGEKVLG